MECAAGEVSRIFGVAKDGFPIYGPMQYYSQDKGKIYTNKANCDADPSCQLRQLMNLQFDKCGGIEIEDGDAALGTTYRYIVSNLFPYHLQCYRGDISLSQQRNGNAWAEYRVNNSCGLNADDNGTCDIFNRAFVNTLGCTPGNCPYTASQVRFQGRAFDHTLDEVYYQCDGCQNAACTTGAATTTTTTTTDMTTRPTTVTYTPECVCDAGFECFSTMKDADVRWTQICLDIDECANGD